MADARPQNLRAENQRLASENRELPGMDGYGVARAVRGDPLLQSTFMVALTGYALPEDLTRARDAGFDEHLAKPPNLEKVEQILARKSLPHAGPTR